MPPSRFSDEVPLTVDRERLILEHLDLVDACVSRLHPRLPREVERDDLVSVGYIALVWAADRYDRSRGVPFGAFARRRIAGALLDYLRKIDPLSRRERRAVTRGEAQDVESVAIADAHDLPHDAAADAWARRRAGHRIDALLTASVPDETDREIVRRVFLQEHEVTDVAADLGLTPRAVQHRATMAVWKMRASAQRLSC